MKQCFKCGVEKPLTEFYKHARMADGHLNKCKNCTKSDVSHRRRTNPKVQEYDRNRPNAYERNLRQALKDKERYRNDPEFRERVLKAKKLWDIKNQHKKEAQTSANNAVRDGKLERKLSCEHCGATDVKLHKHHWSYLPEHHLDVTWLCPRCHGKEHKRLNEIGRDPDKPSAHIPF